MLKRSLVVGVVLALTGCVVAPGYGAYEQGYYGAPVYDAVPAYGYAPPYGAVEFSGGGYRDGYDRRRADPPPRDGGHSAHVDAQERGGGRGGSPGAGSIRQGRQADSGRGHDDADGQHGYGR
ncbi:hypothetical protein [Paraburkholderia dinghuensis]|uniref:hypothetical protein n=1 Tax=Paraburkholderia dinghuensis TaxID=2305225 RepID=UPI00162AF314|nr:hypothetical protein [Paraburkholderia dinghuensis]